MKTYYLTEMNVLQLENTLLKFILQNQVDPKLTNGIIGKVAAMMYNTNIDYYYADSLATTLEVPIQHIDKIYLNGYNDCYKQPLKQLLLKVEAPETIVKNADLLEDQVQQIIKTRKPIKTKKPKKHLL